MKRILFGLILLASGCGQASATPADDDSKPADPQTSATQKPVTLNLPPIDPEIAKRVKLQILDFKQIEALIASHKGKLVVIDCWSTS